MKSRINEYTIKNNKIQTYHKIMNISDIHSNLKELENILYMLEMIKPSVVTMPGDIIDSVNDSNIKIMYQKMLELCTKYKTYISIGNHDTVEFVKINEKRKEIDTGDYHFFEALRNEGANVIYNTNNGIALSGDINIYGVNPSVAWYQNGENKNEFLELMEDYRFSSDKFNVLLSHTPNGFIKDGILNSRPNMDLILSGHNHGGLVPQFIQDHSKNNTGLVGPYGKVLFKNAYGVYSDVNSSLIISNGVTKIADSNEVSSVAKIVNKYFIPDVDVINLEPSEENEIHLEKRYILK